MIFFFFIQTDQFFFQDVSLFFLVGGRLNVFQKQVGQVKEVVISIIISYKRSIVLKVKICITRS